MSQGDDGKPPRTPIPPQIKRNTLLLALMQALIATGFQLIPSLGALIMLRFTDALALVGLTLSIGRITAPLMAYPAGRLADSRGRKPVLYLGLLLGSVGSITIFYSVAVSSLGIFLRGLVVYGLGLGALSQITVAAIDMYPPAQRGEGVSYVLSGNALGSLGSPMLVWATTSYATTHGLDSLGVPWLVPPVLLALCGVMVYFIRPDPLDIARDKGRFYPGLEVKKKAVSGGPEVSISSLLRKSSVIGAIINGTLALGVMMMMMALASVILRQNDYSLTMISVAIAIHVVGMFGFSTIFGRLADRRGRKLLFYIGSIVLAFSGLVTLLTSDYWAITGGLFLVGVGWSAVNVGSTAMMGDSVPPTSMGQIMGINQLVGGALALLIPTIGGTIAQRYGVPAVGVASLVLSAPILFVAFRLKERSPGVFD
ncbi:MAG: MFS transporter [Candidatus Bathyarchaeia archaeon]